MSEYIIELPNGGAADECIRLRGYEKSLYGYELREEIVRCRDCKRYDPNAPSINSCRFELEGYVEWRSAAPDCFCAWGERREK